MVTWAPTPGDVHAEIPQRAAGGFTATTTPTVDQVQRIITNVVAELVAEVGTFDPAEVINPTAPLADQVTLADLARNAAALGAASRIEDRFFPEQQAPAGPYGVEVDGGNQHLWGRWQKAIKALQTAIDRPGGTAFTGSMPIVLPAVQSLRRRHP